MKPGDIIWQSRGPGGECLLVKVFFTKESYDRDCIWIDNDWPILRVLHPVEGLIDDPPYYYDTLEDAKAFALRQREWEQENEAGR